MHAWYVALIFWALFAPIMWTLTTGFGLAVRACLAALVCFHYDFYFFPFGLFGRVGCQG